MTPGRTPTLCLGPVRFVEFADLTVLAGQGLHVYIVDMKRMGTRRRGALALGLIALLVLATACSDGVRDADRTSVERGASSGSAWSGAAGCEAQTPNLAQYAMYGSRGYPYCSVNVLAYCNEAGNYGVQLPDITLCFALTNKTRKFTAPDTLSSKFPLTLTNAYCESYRQSGSSDKGYLDDQGLCSSTGGYRGSVRVYNSDELFKDQPRLLNPNPFMETAAVQFMPHRQSTGPDVRIFVSSLMAPFSDRQSAAQAEAVAPFSGSNEFRECAQGEYLSCRLTRGFGAKEWNPRAYIDIGNYPIRLQIRNSSGRPMRLLSSSAGSGLLIDPVALGSVDNIPAGGTAYVGGYLAANSSSAEMSWTGSYCIETLTGCVGVTVTFRLKFASDKDALDPNSRNYTNVSTCIPENDRAQVTYKCDTPTWNNSVESPVVTANVRNF